MIMEKSKIEYGLVDKEEVMSYANKVVTLSIDAQEEYAAYYGRVIRKLKDLVEEAKDLHSQCVSKSRFNESKYFYDFIDIYNKNIEIFTTAYNTVVDHLRNVEGVNTYSLI